MQRKALIGALVLIGVGVVLGATVFRTDIAQATGARAVGDGQQHRRAGGARAGTGSVTAGSGARRRNVRQ